MCELFVGAYARCLSVFFATGLLAGCLATLPDPVYSNDPDVFKKDDNTYKNAQSCASHLTDLRRSARNRSWLRTLTTIFAGSTTAVSSYVAATKADGDPGKAKVSAEVALVAGLVAVFAQAIPDPSEALDKHRDASASWVEARHLAFAAGDTKVIFAHLDNCRANRPPQQTIPTKQGTPID